MLSRLDQSSPQGPFDVCVVGAGPAGIITALSLARKGRSVVLLEGGGLRAPGETGAALYEGESVGLDYPVRTSRLRFFGGTSNHWGGWVRPLDRSEFEQKDHFDLPGWPISFDELNRHYAKAAEWCEVAGDNYDPQAVLGERAPQLLPLADSRLLENRLFRFSPPTRFGQRYRPDIDAQDNLTALFDANLIGVRWQGDRLDSLQVSNLSGSHQTAIRADRYVFAMGGMENARILLNLQAQVAAGHALSGHDFIGRCFMDHFGFQPGNLLTGAGVRYLRFNHDGVPLQPVMAIRPEAIGAEQMNNACILLNPRDPSASLGNRYLDNPGFSTLDGPFSRYRIQVINEPSPLPDSRITLSDDRDSLGLRKLRLNWQVNPRDFVSLRKLIDGLITDLGALGLGRFERIKPLDETTTSRLSMGMHHMGTVRMADSIEHGVVDSDSRVFGIPNLYLAGSGVFPYVGFSNPTLTIAALASRLADHLVDDLVGDTATDMENAHAAA